MRKISMILAVLLMLGMLAGCNAKTPNYRIENYELDLVIPSGWTQTEESWYDLELHKGDATILVRAYIPLDFMDEMLDLEELFTLDTDHLLMQKEDVQVKEEKKTFESDGKDISTTLYTAKDGDETLQYLCCQVEFNNDGQTVAWVAFIADEKTMDKNRKTYETILKDMKCESTLITQAMLDEQEAAVMEELEAQETQGN